MGAVELHRTHTDKGTVQLNEVASQADVTFRVIAKHEHAGCATVYSDATLTLTMSPRARLAWA